MNLPEPTRRDFLKHTSLGGLSFLWNPPTPAKQPTPLTPATIQPVIEVNKQLDLAPARWIWYPMERCLANTVVLFRKDFNLSEKPLSAKGYVLGDSRYIAFANGQRIQFGPAPADPRFAEADPIDLTPILKVGRNTIGTQVLYYGHGDGTWPIGKPGFIFKLEIELPSGSQQLIVSDGTWQCHIARSWRPGQYKRWYLRAFQEEFDNRLYPRGWNTPDFTPFEEWLRAMELEGAANKPAINLKFNDYANDLNEAIPSSQLRERSVPMLQETKVPVAQLAESAWVRWKRPVIEYFESLTKDAYQVIRTPSVTERSTQNWTVNLDDERGALLTFEFNTQIVGFPFFTIDAPSGTTIELMVQEAHTVGGTPLLNTKFNSWTRFICRSGKNTFETFDYESFRWVQLHIHGANGAVTISNVGARKRQYPWPNSPRISCSDIKIQKVLDACINTINNSAQETIVDGMARERQQYSGDCGHQLHAIQSAFGDTHLHARFINTYSQGITQEGYFLDAWPAFDRLERLIERQLQLSSWGPILDHSIGFNFDCWYYYLYTSDKSALVEVFPRLVHFFNYLLKIRQSNGLLPVENIGVPSVWIDHSAYLQQRHKQCAFNLYAVAMLQKAFAPLCELFEKPDVSAKAKQLSNEILASTIRLFWSPSKAIFVNNLPWLSEEKEERLCDRSLATAVMYDLCPDDLTKNAITALAAPPPNLGLSYPANANWRYWALAKAGIVQPIIDDFRTKWHDIESVNLNNTIAEWWHVNPDNGQQWSHCAVAPLFIMYQHIIGIRPLTPGSDRIQIRPQLGDIDIISATIHTVKGPILFKSRGKIGNRIINIKLPAGVSAELVLPAKENMGSAAIIPTVYIVPTLSKPAKIVTPNPPKNMPTAPPRALQLASLAVTETATKRYKLESGQEHQFIFKTI